MLQTETVSDQLLRNFMDLPPAGHLFLAQLLRRLVHLVSDGLFLVPANPFQSFQLRTHLRDLTLHAVKLRLPDMLAPCQQVEHFLAGVADVTQQLVLVRGQIPIRTLECVYTGGAQPESTNCISTPTQNHILRKRCNQSKKVATGASDSNDCCVPVSMSSKLIHTKCPSCV